MNRNYSNFEQKIQRVFKCKEIKAKEVDSVLTDRQARFPEPFLKSQNLAYL